MPDKAKFQRAFTTADADVVYSTINWWKRSSSVISQRAMRLIRAFLAEHLVSVSKDLPEQRMNIWHCIVMMVTVTQGDDESSQNLIPNFALCHSKNGYERTDNHGHKINNCNEWGCESDCMIQNSFPVVTCVFARARACAKVVQNNPKSVSLRAHTSNFEHVAKRCCCPH